MLTAKEKADKLREAIALLQDVDCLQQVGMADLDGDVCYELHNEIDNIIYTLEEAIEELGD
jgi:hypothetical protein